VLTTGEIQTMLQEKGIDFKALPPSDLEGLYSTLSEDRSQLLAARDTG